MRIYSETQSFPVRQGIGSPGHGLIPAMSWGLASRGGASVNAKSKPAKAAHAKGSVRVAGHMQRIPPRSGGEGRLAGRPLANGEGIRMKFVRASVEQWIKALEEQTI